MIGAATDDLPCVVRAFLGAVEAPDVVALGRCFTDDASYAFAMPQPPARGRAAIEQAFARALDKAERIRRDIEGSTAAGDVVWLERVDRFCVSSARQRSSASAS